jgi:hypothetical protein
MAKKKYHGSCECERVRFEVELDLGAGTFMCICRICTKGRFWGAGVSQSDLHMISGESELTAYATLGHPTHYFCRHCGTKVFGKMDMPPPKGPSAAISLATLDDLDPKEWSQAPVHVFDGKHDRFDRAAEFSAHL